MFTRGEGIVNYLMKLVMKRWNLVLQVWGLGYCKLPDGAGYVKMEPVLQVWGGVL